MACYGAAEAHMQSGKELQCRNLIREACAEYRDAIAADERCVEAYIQWGRALAELGNHHDALDRYRAALPVGQANDDTYDFIAVELDQLAEPDAAIATLQLVIDRLDDAAAYSRWAAVLLRLPRYDLAATEYQNDDDPAAHAGLGRTLAALGQRAGAVQHYTRSIRLAPERQATYDSLADWLTKVNRHQPLVARIQTAVDEIGLPELSLAGVCSSEVTHRRWPGAVAWMVEAVASNEVS